MRRLVCGVLIAASLFLSGCCSLFATDEDLLRKVREGLVESTRPMLVNSLEASRDHDGMIDELRTEKVRTVDQMIDSIDRVYPPVDREGNPEPYLPEPLPWTHLPTIENEDELELPPLDGPLPPLDGDE